MGACPKEYNRIGPEIVCPHKSGPCRQPTWWAEWFLSLEILSFTFPVGDLSCPASWVSTTAKAARTFRVRPKLPNPSPNTPHDQIHCKRSFVATDFHPNQRSFFLLDPKVWNATSISFSPIQVEQLQLHQNTCLQTFAPGDAINTHRFLLQVSKVSARKNKNSNPRSAIARFTPKVSCNAC